MKRIPHFDGIRGIAIVSVVIWHYFDVRTPTMPGSWLRAAKYFTVLSWSGVDLFFVLSGFLITGILLDERDAPNYFRAFYVRRIGRIIPLYLLLMTGYELCLHLAFFQRRPFSPLFHPQLPLWCYATFTQNLVMGARHVFGGDWVNVTWSLGPEEQFYAVIPCLIFLWGGSVLPYFLGAFLVLAPTLRFVSPGFHVMYNTLWRADGLAAGAMLAWAMRRPGWFEAVNRRRYWLLALFGLLFAAMAAQSRWQECFGIFGYTSIAAFYSVGLLVTLLETQSLARHILAWTPLVWLGRRSYGIYLIHMPVYGVLFGLLAMSSIVHTDPFLGFKILMSAAVAGTLILAEISFRLLEGPFIGWSKRCAYDGKGSLANTPNRKGSRTNI